MPALPEACSFLPLPGGQYGAVSQPPGPREGTPLSCVPTQEFQEDLGTQWGPQPMTGKGGLGKGGVLFPGLGWGPANRRAGPGDLRPSSFFGNHDVPIPSPERSQALRCHGDGRWEHSTWLWLTSGLEETLGQPTAKFPTPGQVSTRPPIPGRPVCWAQRRLFEHLRMKRPTLRLRSFCLEDQTRPPSPATEAEAPSGKTQQGDLLPLVGGLPSPVLPHQLHPGGVGREPQAGTLSKLLIVVKWTKVYF